MTVAAAAERSKLSTMLRLAGDASKASVQYGTLVISI